MYIPHKAQQTLTTDTQAVSVATYLTTIANATGAPYAYTLASGVVINQIKKIVMNVATSTIVVTGVYNASGTTLTFSVVGDAVELLWDGSLWVVIAIYNQATGSVATPVLA